MHKLNSELFQSTEDDDLHINGTQFNSIQQTIFECLWHVKLATWNLFQHLDLLKYTTDLSQTFIILTAWLYVLKSPLIYQLP